MKEVTIDGVVYVPKVEKKKVLITNYMHLPIELFGNELEKSQAYYNILKICAYLNNEFQSDGRKWVIIDTIVLSFSTNSITSIYHFTSKEAAEYALLHFKQTFKTFYS